MLDDIVFLLDGEVLMADFEDDSFVVRIISTGEERLVRRAFQVKWRNRRFVLVWRGRNGQQFAIPMAEGA